MEGRKNGEKRFIKTDMRGDFNCDPKSRGVQVGQPSDSGIFYFHAKPLVVKGFAKQYPISWILRREPLPGGRAHDFNEKRPKFSGRLEQATSPRRSPENRLNEKHTPV